MKRARAQEPVQGRTRARLAALLHGKSPSVPYDNSRVWGGALRIVINGRELPPDMCRIFLDTDAGETVTARIRAELFADGVTNNGPLRPEHADARLWLDVNEHGFHDERGVHHPPLPRYEPMRLCEIPPSRPGAAVFESDEFAISATGVFHYTAAFSADSLPFQDPAKQWITVNQLSDNRDGVIVCSPASVRGCPSIAEVCIRKYGSAVQDGAFRSGRIRDLADDLENIPAEVIYLLPFFLPGTMDSHTGEDVRKGELGSIYAVKDFFRIDPALVTPPAETDIPGLVSLGLITGQDLAELLTGEQQNELRFVNDLAARPVQELLALLGPDTLTQLIGRAEMRWLVDKAHGLDKRVIFDLVLMQTSRDCPLIDQHIEWYALDEHGRPRKHSIAWLDYSDVALFDLKFNKPLQNYLSGVAPYWISVCDFDGVRIDAAQTVDRPFLKQIKNRINAIKPGAIVLGETLCPMEQAADVTTDMFYTLLVDHHVHSQSANAYFDIFEEIHARFAPGAVGMAYFENHDSRRATRAWHEQYHERMLREPELFHYWAAQAAGAVPAPMRENPWDVAYYPALFKNILCSVINCCAGSSDRVRFAYAFEMGTDYGEEQRTDFENSSPLYPHLRTESPHSLLHEAYNELARVKAAHPLLHQGSVWYLRNGGPGGDPADQLMTWVKYDASRAILIACNLDPASAHRACHPLPFAPLDPQCEYRVVSLCDTYALLGAMHRNRLREQITGAELMGTGLPLLLPPLCALILDLVPAHA